VCLLCVHACVFVRACVGIGGTVRSLAHFSPNFPPDFTPPQLHSDKYKWKGISARKAILSLATFKQPITLKNMKAVGALPAVGKGTIALVRFGGVQAFAAFFFGGGGGAACCYVLSGRVGFGFRRVHMSVSLFLVGIMRARTVGRGGVRSGGRRPDWLGETEGCSEKYKDADPATATGRPHDPPPPSPPSPPATAAARGAAGATAAAGRAVVPRPAGRAAAVRLPRLPAAPCAARPARGGTGYAGRGRRLGAGSFRHDQRR
jgi:hypothetical protein